MCTEIQTYRWSSPFICYNVCQTNNEMQCNIYSQIRALWFYSLESSQVDISAQGVPGEGYRALLNICKWVYFLCKPNRESFTIRLWGEWISQFIKEGERPQFRVWRMIFLLLLGRFHLGFRSENLESVFGDRNSKGSNSVYSVLYFIKWGRIYRKGWYRKPLEE